MVTGAFGFVPFGMAVSWKLQQFRFGSDAESLNKNRYDADDKPGTTHTYRTYRMNFREPCKLFALTKTHKLNRAISRHWETNWPKSSTIVPWFISRYLRNKMSEDLWTLLTSHFYVLPCVAYVRYYFLFVHTAFLEFERDFKSQGIKNRDKSHRIRHEFNGIHGFQRIHRIVGICGFCEIRGFKRIHRTSSCIR